MAKLYYAKRKLVWEFLEGPLKKKIEIQWSDIGAMRAIIGDDQPGVWEIEVNLILHFKCFFIIISNPNQSWV